MPVLCYPMPMPIDRNRLKRILIERRSYPLMLVGVIIFLSSWFVSGSTPALIGWVLFIVGIVEYFRGFR